MNEKNKRLNAAAEWIKAEQAFQEATLLLKEEMVEGALSRSYYAAFHATKALLLTEGLEAKTHQGTGRLFSLHFVKTGKIDKKFSRILSRAQKDREEADYFSEYVFSLEEAQQRAEEVKEFLNQAEILLRKTGCLQS